MTNPWRDIEAAIREAIAAPFFIESRAVAGSGISDYYCVRSKSLSCFVKVGGADKADMFAAEAAGLEEIAHAHAVRVPKPLCHGANRDTSWLVLEHLELRPADERAMRTLGANLACMHRLTRDHYGWSRNNTIGSTLQVNTPSDDWVKFWRERRLGFQLGLAQSRGHGRLMAGGDRLLEKLPAFFKGYRPLPSLLHGDLWSGNSAMLPGGEPLIYDPALYYGDRESDLAMTELFGGFPPSFYEAYRAEYPLDPGYEIRKPLYNLYHVLNHLNLFGGGYGAQAEHMIERLLAHA